MQRRAMSAEVDRLLTRFGSFNRLSSRERAAILEPRVIIAGIIAIVALRRLRGVDTIGRLLLLTAAARRLWRVVKTI